MTDRAVCTSVEMKMQPTFAKSVPPSQSPALDFSFQSQVVFLWEPAQSVCLKEHCAEQNLKIKTISIATHLLALEEDWPLRPIN